MSACCLVDGGQFWVNGTQTLHLHQSAYSMNGAGGQHTIIDPVNDLVIVRLGHRLGGEANLPSSYGVATADLLVFATSSRRWWVSFPFSSLRVHSVLQEKQVQRLER